MAATNWEISGFGAPWDGMRTQPEQAATDEQPPLPERLSPSRAEDFAKCPRLFYYRAVERRFEPGTPATIRGRVVHGALERLFELPRIERTESRALELIESEWQAIADDPDVTAAEVDADAIRDEAANMVRRYFSVEDPRTFDADAQELRLTAQLGGVEIVGILDRLEAGPDGVTITDYKTGRAPKPDYQDGAFFAMRVYAALLTEVEGIHVDSLRLIYLGGDEPVVLTRRTNPDDRSRAVERMVSIWKGIRRQWRSGEWEPKPSKLCQWCYFSDICPAFVGDAPLEDPREDRRLIEVGRQHPGIAGLAGLT